jgi:serine/threonine protein kinase
MHAAGWIHRDIRPANLLQYRQNLLLIDFGFATEVGTEVNYSGTVHYASNNILSALAAGRRSISCSPADDLVSVVRSVFAMIFNHFENGLSGIQGHQYDDIMQYWTKLDDMVPWKECIDRALSANHDELCEALRVLIP